MISPSDLPWWGWFLCSFGAWIACIIVANIADAIEDGAGCLVGIIALVLGVIGAGTGVVGLILFVKWVWTS